MLYVSTDEKIAGILTKELPKKQLDKLVLKLAMEGIFKPTNSLRFNQIIFFCVWQDVYGVNIS